MRPFRPFNDSHIRESHDDRVPWIDSTKVPKPERRVYTKVFFRVNEYTKNNDVYLSTQRWKGTET